MKHRKQYRDMKKNDLAVIMSVALTTTILTVAAFWTTSLEAGGEAEAVAPKIAKPKLVAQGVEMTLAARDGTARVGQEPVLELVAINTTANPADIKVHLAMNAVSLADALSRVVRMPKSIWECDQSLVLKPGEQKTLTLKTATKLPAKSMVSVMLNEVRHEALGSSAGSVQPTFAVLNFSTENGPSFLASLPRD